MSRTRPQHQARAIRCRECGAPFELTDERTVMYVCQHCGTQLDLSEAEQRVLQRGVARPAGIEYRLNLGERLSIRGASYEVIARVCLTEDDDVEDQTHQYYLYHPSRRPLWLSYYAGLFDLTWRTRVRPKGDVFRDPVDTFTTYDGRQWDRGEIGIAVVHHVDGALPYVQRRGDVVAFVELALRGDLGTLYEATRTADEIEYAEGVSVSTAEVASWVGREIAPFRPPTEYLKAQPLFLEIYKLGPTGAISIGMTAVVAIFLFGFGWSDAWSGRQVLRQVLDPGAASVPQPGGSFTVPQDDGVVRIHLSAPLTNAWLYGQVALVEEDGDTVVHVDETDIGFYAGRQGGESWTEGTREADLFVAVEEAGSYRLMLGGQSGHGESPSSVLLHPLQADVFVDAAYRSAATLGGVITIVLGVFAVMLLMAARRLIDDSDRRRRVGRISNIALGAVLALVVVGSLIESSNGWGAPELEHPEGISIRQSSLSGVEHASFFMIYNSPRSHLGGGVHAGK